jgi:hypothetical protein
VALNKCPYGKLQLPDSTVLFTTYASLVARRQVRGKNSSRLDQPGDTVILRCRWVPLVAIP